MTKPYDVSIKELLRWAGGWLGLIGLPPELKLREIDAELSTVIAAADKAFFVEDNPPWILHVEAQSGLDVKLLSRTLCYNAQLHFKEGLPVLSVVVLLHPQADHASFTGQFEFSVQVAGQPRGRTALSYQVIRIWETPVELLLAGDPGTLPLAPLSRDVTLSTLPDTLRKMEQRMRGLPPDECQRLGMVTYLLLGLKFRPEDVVSLMEVMGDMRESTTYQYILNQGKVQGISEGKALGISEGKALGRQEGIEIGAQSGQLQEARATVLHLGTLRLGDPGPTMKAFIASCQDLETLHRMRDKLITAASWAEALQS